MLLVMAGKPVDDFIETLLPHLDQGDIVIDGGNSHYPDTNRRTEYLRKKGVRFVGTGVSGGEEGARYGPSLMPGGNEEAWPLIKDIFQSIAAKSDGEPCCEWVGDQGAGHYVKMVHNGIEYGDMQLICEVRHPFAICNYIERCCNFSFDVSHMAVLTLVNTDNYRPTKS
jgi:6-phosphogluconate dehydrogenase